MKNLRWVSKTITNDNAEDSVDYNKALIFNVLHAKLDDAFTRSVISRNRHSLIYIFFISPYIK